MSPQILEMVKDVPHKTKRGLEFKISLTKRQLTAEHNYWLYFITAHHTNLGNQSFTVLVMKQAFPDERLADALASNLAIDEAKTRLEAANEDGRPLLLPFFTEGWALI
jgi:hypothetical protein